MKRTYYTKHHRRPKTKFFIFLLLVGLSFITIYFLVNALNVKPAPEKFTPYPTLLPSAPTPENATPTRESLGKTVQDALIGTRGSYSVVVKNLKTNESYSLNEHVSFDTASLYKLWIMAETYSQIKNGTLKEDAVLSEDVKMLNDKFNIASESAELSEGTITLSVRDALNKMIAISDNYAAFLLGATIRLSKVTSFLKANEFNESSVGLYGSTPTTTAYDIALFFEKLYNAKLIDEEYSASMLQLLKTQKLNNKIPKYLPDNIPIAHKTGELDPYTHDAGIVYAPNGDYIIVILSKSNDPDLAEDKIANVSKAVYDYFENNK